MKRAFFPAILIFLTVVSCSENKNKGGVSPRTRKELTDIATKYAKDQFENLKKTVDDDGTIRIGNGQISYTIDPSQMITGLINEDSSEDAIISIRFFNGRFLERIEHLFLMKTNGKFEISRVDVNLMKIIEIRDRIIYAQVSKVAPDSPTYGCPVCMEIVRYRYRDGNLVLEESNPIK